MTLARVAAALDRHLIDGWRTEWKRLWSIRVAMLWIVVSSLLGVWGAFFYVVPGWLWAGLGFAMGVSYGVARYLKQPGTM
jgi:hypothetical protein